MDAASLHRLARKGNLKKVRQFISQVKHKEDLEDIFKARFGGDGYTVLHQAVIGNNSKLLDYLLQCAKRLDYEAKDRSTPLQLAYRLNSAAAVSTLLEHGATIPFKDTRDSSLCPWQPAGTHKQFLEACKGGRRVSLSGREDATWQRLLATTDGRQLYTPIHHTAANGQAKLLDFFLSKSLPGVCVQYQTKDGSTALHLAAHRRHTDCVRVLLNYGAKIHIRDRSSKTATEVAHSSTLGILMSEGRHTVILYLFDFKAYRKLVCTHGHMSAHA